VLAKIINYHKCAYLLTIFLKIPVLLADIYFYYLLINGFCILSLLKNNSR